LIRNTPLSPQLPSEVPAGEHEGEERALGMKSELEVEKKGKDLPGEKNNISY